MVAVVLSRRAHMRHKCGPMFSLPNYVLDPELTIGQAMPPVEIHPPSRDASALAEASGGTMRTPT